MPRPLRIESPGAFYHVISRGNAKQDIFLTNADRVDFLETLNKVVNRFAWICHAYCLMTNHYHLLIETPEANLSAGMRNLNSIYCQSFNRKLSRIGHVVQGRYQSLLIKNDSHLVELFRYIALNPVRAGLVSEPRQWEWSSYRAVAGFALVPVFLEVKHVLSLFSDDINKARESYIKFIEDGFAAGESAIRLKSHTLRELFLGADDKRLRNIAMCKAYADYRYSMTEIAAFLKVSCSTVSRVITKS